MRPRNPRVAGKTASRSRCSSPKQSRTGRHDHRLPARATTRCWITPEAITHTPSAPATGTDVAVARSSWPLSANSGSRDLSYRRPHQRQSSHRRAAGSTGSVQCGRQLEVAAVPASTRLLAPRLQALGARFWQRGDLPPQWRLNSARRAKRVSRGLAARDASCRRSGEERQSWYPPCFRGLDVPGDPVSMPRATRGRAGAPMQLADHVAGVRACAAVQKGQRGRWPRRLLLLADAGVTATTIASPSAWKRWSRR
jgi:hypothetical protein